MLKARQALLLGLIALSAPWGAPARAQDPYGLGYGYLFGYGATNTPGIRSFVPAPPYFALHPPVYYGQRYTRPYGDSPFASWPQLQPAAGYHVHPAASHAQVIANPYAAPCCLESSDTSPVVGDAAAPVQPLVIDNPYFSTAEAGRLVSKAESDEAPTVGN
jgi:hypothetical protein